MFLTKVNSIDASTPSEITLIAQHLMVDWRLGERHFMQSTAHHNSLLDLLAHRILGFIDGDLMSNNGGWQYAYTIIFTFITYLVPCLKVVRLHWDGCTAVFQNIQPLPSEREGNRAW